MLNEEEKLAMTTLRLPVLCARRCPMVQLLGFVSHDAGRHDVHCEANYLTCTFSWWVSHRLLQLLQDSMKKKELKPVDHSKISYMNVRKNLYIIPKALAGQGEDEVRFRSSPMKS